MKKAGKLQGLYQKDGVKAILWNVILLFVLLFLFQPAYEVNDDRYMCQIAEGVYGSPDAHLIFINIVLGKILSTLYTWIGWIKWYNVFHYFTLFLAFTSVTYVFLKKYAGGRMRIVWSLLVMAFAYEAYVNVQFTKTAGIGAAAGYLLLFLALERRDWHSGVPAVLLLLLGSMYRFRCFLIVSLPMFVLGIYELVRVLRTEDGGQLRREILRYTVTLAAIIGAVFALHGVDSYAYQSDPEWKAYREFNALRSQVMDYEIPDWESHQEEYEALGLTQSDVINITRWMFADFEQVDVDTWQGILEIREGSETPKSVLAFGKAVWKNLSVSPLFLVTAILCILLLLDNGEGRNVGLFLVAGGLLLGMHAYLYWQGRYGVSRVDLVTYFSILCLLLYQWRPAADPAPVRKAGGALAVAGLAVFVLALNAESVSTHLRKNTVSDEGLERFFAYMTADEEHLYYIDTHDEFLGKVYGFSEIAPVGLADNLYEMGGWMTRSPLFGRTLQNYGIRNPLQALGEREDIYVVENTNYIQEKVSSLRQHYAENMDYSLVKYIEGVHVYKVYPRGDLFAEEELQAKRPGTDFGFIIQEDGAGNVVINGYACTAQENSYGQQIVIRLQDTGTGEYRDYYAIQTEYGAMSCEEERYAGFSLTVSGSELPEETCRMTIVQLAAGEAYLLEQCEQTFQERE